MDNDEKRINRIMALVFFLLMLGVLAFMIKKNENAEKTGETNPSPVVTATTVPQD